MCAVGLPAEASPDEMQASHKYMPPDISYDPILTNFDSVFDSRGSPVVIGHLGSASTKGRDVGSLLSQPVTHGSSGKLVLGWVGGWWKEQGWGK